MISKTKKISLGLLVLGLCLQCSEPNTHVEIIPLPEQEIPGTGFFLFDEQTSILCTDSTEQIAAKQLAGLFTKSAGFTPEVKLLPKQTNASITFKTDTTLAASNYKLEITPSHIEITASDAQGHFYAVQSLRMMLPPEIESGEKISSIKWEVPALTLQDGPRFPYRGMMLDVARTFIPKENVLKLIDGMAILKLNYLHFHLTDDNGWRLEIKKYPKLTEVGAWRVYREGDFAQRRNAQKGEPATIGGFYTQEDIREIVRYAAERQIEVIPEIEMPAHTNSSLAAYPELACPVVKDFIGVIPGMGGNSYKIVYCAGNEKVFSFLQDVLDEVAELFPAPYIHLGGDEASKENWEKCPLCQARMKAEGITHSEDLQGYFMNRVADYVKSKGKQVMGWEELVNSRIPDGAVIYGWQGMGEVGYKAGKQGHPFIMTPARVLYMIRYQGPQWFEPRTYFGNNTLKDVYDYEPVKPEWEAAAVKNLMGVQGSLWTEFLNKPEDAEYLLFPRMAALAEIAWSPQGKKDWAGFLKRLDKLTQHYDRMDIHYARSMYNIDHLITSENQLLNVSLSCIRPDVEIHFTTDGSEPDGRSPLYREAFPVTTSQTIKAATFMNGEQKGQTLVLPIQWNKATACPIIDGNEQTYRLTNGLRGSDKHSDFEWSGWYNKNASFTIDLQKEDSINQVTVGCITNYGMAIHTPKNIRLFLSADGKNFAQIGEKHFTNEEIFKEGIHLEDKVFDNIHAFGRYLKVELDNPGKCPVNHIRPEQGTWVYIDEIGVN